MENDNRRMLQYDYQHGTEKRGYQPSTNTQNSSNNSSTTQLPKGGNVAQKD